ncbi:polyketide cyclase/dehydrase and lipid transport superfamily protein [Actinidia rufa]|uniref:Polyketide cyclase/dehydrase and lipid transport superfamily protein n=1 Tax=Actinidia rufa TaxID=165716 RepID=A0A7J0FGI5_9ERIC|nr:polyketide cyclase/dehydrase and lipid transport superfamily protein [Actinidia rufa]
MLGVSSKEFWRENGGGGGWGTNTLVVLLVLFICQLAAKTRFWLWFRLLLFPNPNIPFRSISPDLKNSPPFPTINSQFRISEIISDLDLKNLIHNLDENSHEHPKWDSVIDRRNSLIAYSAKCCKPKDGPLKYLSVTIFDNCSAESLRDFYMDNNYRKNWDKTLIEHEQLQVNESNGTEIGRIIKKFPLLTAREYLLAWRVWESKDGTFYCFSKVVGHNALNIFAFIFVPPPPFPSIADVFYGTAEILTVALCGTLTTQAKEAELGMNKINAAEPWGHL